MDQNQYNYQQNQQNYQQGYQQNYNPNSPMISTKAACMIAYLGFIGILFAGVFGDKYNPDVKFHLNQGIGLALISVFCPFVPIVGEIALIVLLVFAIIGIVYANKLERKELPIVSKWTFLN